MTYYGKPGLLWHNYMNAFVKVSVWFFHNVLSLYLKNKNFFCNDVFQTEIRYFCIWWQKACNISRHWGGRNTQPWEHDLTNTPRYTLVIRTNTLQLTKTSKSNDIIKNYIKSEHRKKNRQQWKNEFSLSRILRHWKQTLQHVKS